MKRRPSAGDVRASTAAASGTLLLTTVAGAGLVALAAETPLTVAAVGGALVALSILVGPAAAVGGAIGLFVHDLFLGSVGYWTPVAAIWILVFVGAVTRLAPDLLSERDTESSNPSRHTVFRYVVVAVVACAYATALAAWLTFVLGGQRFYTVVSGLLLGTVFAIGLGAPVLLFVSGRPGRRFDLPIGRGHTLTLSVHGTDSETRGAARPGDPTLRTLLGLFALGIVWLGCATVLDVLVHDMVRFETVGQLRQYVGSIFGDSPLATVAGAGLVGIYRYGELAVRLSAPVVAVVVWLLYGRERRLFGPMSRRLDAVQWGSSDD